MEKQFVIKLFSSVSPDDFPAFGTACKTRDEFRACIETECTPAMYRESFGHRDGQNDEFWILARTSGGQICFVSKSFMDYGTSAYMAGRHFENQIESAEMSQAEYEEFLCRTFPRAR